MKVCFVGNYDSNYSRNKILIKGYKQNNFEVIECKTNKKGIAKYIDLYFRIKDINNIDFFHVGFPGYGIPVLVKVFNKPIIFDAFTSQYDSLVEDRKTVKKYSISSLKYYLTDWVSCVFSNFILLDTNQQINYYLKKFKIKKDKFIRVYVGFDDNWKLNKIERKGDITNIIFYGTYIPLQGVEIVLSAVKKLDINRHKITIVGSRIKKLYSNKYNNYPNIVFKENVPYNVLLKLISESDINLGVFGNTDKARRVISNKIYDGLGVGTPTITADTPAVHELLEDKKNIILCKSADSEDLRNKILELSKNASLKKSLCIEGKKLCDGLLTPKYLVNKLLQDINIK